MPHCRTCRPEGDTDMIEARGLTKRYGDTLAVDNLSFSVAPGKITGFLGPNGAGQDHDDADDPGPGRSRRPARSRSTGKPFARLAQPMREVGALLDAKALHGGRSAYNHLLCLAQSNNLPTQRVDEVLAWSVCPRSPGSGPRGSRSAWGSGSASPAPCSATRRS